jgi:large subunit ribosomal protein L10
MPTTEKASTIEQAKEWYSKAAGVVFTDYRGLKVKDMQALRTALKAKNAEIHIIKNTLFRIAAGDDVQALPYELHNGPTAVTFIYGSESEAAKALVDFAKAHDKFNVKGAFFSGKAFTDKDVVSLSKLPSKDVLIAQVIGAISAPLTNLVGVIEALYADPIRTIGAVADKAAEGSPIPEAPAPVTAEAPAAEAPTAE